jgi:hypothetical protein
MTQLKLIPRSNVLPLGVAQVLKREANRQRETKGNDYLSGATQPALPLTWQRLELIKAYGNPGARNAEKPCGLPQGSTFSAGRPYGATEWNFKTDEIGDLYLSVPNTGESESIGMGV